MKPNLTKLAQPTIIFSSIGKRIAIFTVIVSSLSPVFAQVNGTWKAGSASGNWSLATNWTGNPSPVPGGAGSTVNLTTGNGGSVFVTIDGAVASRTAGILNFDGSSPWTVSADGGGTLTMDNSGSNAQINVAASNTGNARVFAPLTLGSSLVATNNSTTGGLELNSVVSETGGARSITKNGSGLLIFEQANTYTGGFTLNSGLVASVNNSGFGTGTLTLNGGTVGNTGGGRFYANTLVIGGDVTLGNGVGGSNTYTGTTTLSGGSRTLNVAGATSLNGIIGDGGNGYSLTKNGAGMLSLGANNTFSGGFVLNSGTVEFSSANGVNGVFGSGTLVLNGGAISGGSFIRNIANAVTLGGNANTATGARVDYDGTLTLTGNRVITNDGIAIYNGTLAETGGSFSYTKEGAGTLWLNMTTHTGGTILNNGQINIGGNSTLASTGGITVNGGILNLGTRTNSVGAVSITGGTISNTSGSGLLSSSAGFTATGGNIDAILAGSGSFTKNGAGTTTFGAAAGGDNTYTGGTVVNAGVLALGANNRIVNSGAVTVNGGSFSLGTFSDQVGAVTLAGGNITSTTGVLTASSYAVQSGSATAILAGSAAVSKTTSGTATFSGVNSYTGSTTVNAGTLIVSGTGSINTTSGVSVSGGLLKYDSSTALNRAVTLSGGTLAYNSSSNYAGTLTFTSGVLGGTNLNGNLSGLAIGTGQSISPGNSPGTAATGNQTWAGGGSYVWELNDATGTDGSDPGWDLLTGTGALSITATSGDKFNINLTTLTLANAAGNAANFVNTTNYNWRIADFSSAITLDTNVFNINVAGFSNAVAGGSSFGLALGSAPGIGGDNTQLYLTYVVPEPSTALLLGLGLLVVLSQLRRRKLTA